MTFNEVMYSEHRRISYTGSPYHGNCSVSQVAVVVRKYSGTMDFDAGSHPRQYCRKNCQGTMLRYAPNVDHFLVNHALGFRVRTNT